MVGETAAEVGALASRTVPPVSGGGGGDLGGGLHWRLPLTPLALQVTARWWRTARQRRHSTAQGVAVLVARPWAPRPAPTTRLPAPRECPEGRAAFSTAIAPGRRHMPVCTSGPSPEAPIQAGLFPGPHTAGCSASSLTVSCPRAQLHGRVCVHFSKCGSPPPSSPHSSGSQGSPPPPRGSPSRRTPRVCAPLPWRTWADPRCLPRLWVGVPTPSCTSHCRGGLLRICIPK